MTPVGFEPTQLALVELESTPLDHSGKVSVTAVCHWRARSCLVFPSGAGRGALGEEFNTVLPIVGRDPTPTVARQNRSFIYPLWNIRLHVPSAMNMIPKATSGELRLRLRQRH